MFACKNNICVPSFPSILAAFHFLVLLHWLGSQIQCQIEISLKGHHLLFSDFKKNMSNIQTL